jgi:hypothetical protein
MKVTNYFNCRQECFFKQNKTFEYLTKMFAKKKKKYDSEEYDPEQQEKIDKKEVERKRVHAAVLTFVNLKKNKLTKESIWESLKNNLIDYNRSNFPKYPLEFEEYIVSEEIYKIKDDTHVHIFLKFNRMVDINKTYKDEGLFDALNTEQKRVRCHYTECRSQELSVTYVLKEDKNPITNSEYIRGRIALKKINKQVNKENQDDQFTEEQFTSKDKAIKIFILANQANNEANIKKLELENYFDLAKAPIFCNPKDYNEGIQINITNNNCDFFFNNNNTEQNEKRKIELKSELTEEIKSELTAELTAKITAELKEEFNKKIVQISMELKADLEKQIERKFSLEKT